MTISLIVAASENNVIGKDNQLLWRLPNDMKFFKNTTWGMPVIMGRKTFESMNGDPLPGRFNFVVTHQQKWETGSAKVKTAYSLEEAIGLAKLTDCREVFIIGGGKVYEESMPLADKIYMTRVHTVTDGDTFFPEINQTEWQLGPCMDFPADDKHAFAYSIQVWLKKKK
ncbi:MAG: dihydrofolate reductase [Bacteroidetes bacterium]|nr:dihydrofolate reductase [Bacteroidota bacterium]MBS1974300.1 dihydrofolate reductase [Bacteroidota bacterium]